MASVDFELDAVERDRLGTGASRALRRLGMIPAVIYGCGGDDPVHIALSSKEIMRNVRSLGKRNFVATIGLKGAGITVVSKACQFDPVSDFPIHFDLVRVSLGGQVEVSVSVRVSGVDVSPGIKKGGSVNHMRHCVDLVCQSDSIPDDVIVDISNLDFGDTVCVSDLVLPDGVTCVQEPCVQLISIAAPMESVSDE